MDVVTLVEVAPRDGFQAICRPIPTSTKIEAIRALASTGLSRIEIGAFVSPKVLPQMADIQDVWAEVRDKARFRASVLVPNVKGAQLALASGITEIVYVLSASESHNQSNVGRSIEGSLQDLYDLAARLNDKPEIFLRVNIATCFDCPFEGTIASDRVLELATRIAFLRSQIEFGICDTTGRANPAQVQELFTALASRIVGSEQTLAFHGHDTFGLGVANALYAYQVGVRIFDAAACGLGGCPFAPGASGNTATEDLVYTFENMGIRTGIDLNAILAAAEQIGSIDPASSGGHLTRIPRERALAAANASA